MIYDREAAVQYANKWWNDYNPAYPKFDVDCTNFVSQCLRAGGAPMWGYPNREKGWWIQGGTWSLSWSTSHSLRWYLATSKKGLTATQVGSADLLEPGDVISYDFQNDGRFDHSTIVTAKIGSMPLVNAHTYNVKQRDWTYKDSYASTPDARYIFFKINDRFS
ncbi:amidase domain-containing protein [Sporosarcina sp. G11-34]|uniref:amidase domain-containing protein n=1 Tax=Sporosarcina sp. G11-34 TaxID=2849605 RepID=UPI0022A947C6|nr:amidase domain-containing protein [Sporosarcina sp. G11-34]MCZ2257449.1 amidase domain-containing protein [Sporosarcina sp. G11-34]